jgi:hypothetical protein
MPILQKPPILAKRWFSPKISTFCKKFISIFAKNANFCKNADFRKKSQLFAKNL